MDYIIYETEAKTRSGVSTGVSTHAVAAGMEGPPSKVGCPAKRSLAEFHDQHSIDGQR